MITEIVILSEATNLAIETCKTCSVKSMFGNAVEQPSRLFGLGVNEEKQARRLFNSDGTHNLQKRSQPERCSLSGSARGPRAVVAGSATTLCLYGTEHHLVSRSTICGSIRRVAEHRRPAACAPHLNCIVPA